MSFHTTHDKEWRTLSVLPRKGSRIISGTPIKLKQEFNEQARGESISTLPPAPSQQLRNGTKLQAICSKPDRARYDRLYRSHV